MQGFNALNMLYISYHYFTDPSATATEDGFAFVSSLINFYAFSENTEFLTQFFAYLASAGYTGAILTNIGQGTSHVPLIINLWQGFLLNSANIWLGLVTLDETDTVVDNALAAKNK